MKKNFERFLNFYYFILHLFTYSEKLPREGGV